jgi:hypothetical protein
MALDLPDLEGRPLLVADLVGTAALALVTALLAVSDADAIVLVGLVVAALLFVGGTVAWSAGFLRAVGRSREEQIDLAGLFYLTGSAPASARRWFLRTWFAQIALAVIAIAVSRPPFAVMAPVWGIGLLTLWASRHATFPPRDDLGGR